MSRHGSVHPPSAPQPVGPGLIFFKTPGFSVIDDNEVKRGQTGASFTNDGA